MGVGSSPVGMVLGHFFLGHNFESRIYGSMSLMLDGSVVCFVLSHGTDLKLSQLICPAARDRRNNEMMCLGVWIVEFYVTFTLVTHKRGAVTNCRKMRFWQSVFSSYIGALAAKHWSQG